MSFLDQDQIGGKLLSILFRNICFLCQNLFMLKLTFCIFLLSATCHAQMMRGTLMDEGRTILGTPEYTIEGISEGYAEYQLAVNREGDVTSARLIKSNLKSTPAKYEIRNHVVKFKFEKGTYYPKFHHVDVKITMTYSGDLRRD